MHPLVIVEPDVVAEPEPRFPWAPVVVQVHLFIFDGAPEPFREHIIPGSPTPIHTDRHPGCRQQFRVVTTGKLAPLIAIPALRRRRRSCLLDRSGDERLLERLVQRPADDIARIPIHHHHQIQPSVTEADLRDINAPDMIGIACRHTAQTVRVDHMSRGGFTQPGSRSNARQPHLAHMSFNRFVINEQPFPPQLCGDTPDPIKRPLSIEFIDPVFDGEFVSRGRHRLIVQT